MSKIKKKLIKTRYIQEALTTFAEDNLIALSECDFVINKVDTYIKSNASSTFELYNKEILEKYKDKEKIINEHIEFHQLFTITAMKKEDDEIELEYNIDYSKYSTHPVLILSPESKIPYKTNKPVDLLKKLFREFNKIKAYHKILINIFDEDMKKYLKILVKYIYAGKFVKKVKHNVYQIHLFPSKICLKLYPFHGVRQYTPRNISKITRLFSDFSEVELFELGGENANKVHRDL